MRSQYNIRTCGILPFIGYEHGLVVVENGRVVKICCLNSFLKKKYKDFASIYTLLNLCDLLVATHAIVDEKSGLAYIMVEERDEWI